VKAAAHARFHARIAVPMSIVSCSGKTLCGWYSVEDAFYNPDVVEMNKAAEYLLRFNDFECFSKIRKQKSKHFRCPNKYPRYWNKKDGELLFHNNAPGGPPSKEDGESNRWEPYWKLDTPFAPCFGDETNYYWQKRVNAGNLHQQRACFKPENRIPNWNYLRLIHFWA